MRGEIKVLVEIIAVVAALVVILVVMWPVLKDALFGAGEKGQCEFSMVISGIANKANNVPFVNLELPPECKMKRVTIDNAAIKNNIPLAISAIKNYQKNPSIPAAAWFTSEKDATEWAVNSIVAKELADCSDKVLHGKLTLFQGGAITEKTACIICSRIQFAKDVPVNSLKLDKLGQVGSFNAWLVSNNINGQTYYDYSTINPTEVAKDPKHAPFFAYSPTSLQAIVYWEYNPSKYEQVSAYIAESPTLAIFSGVVAGTVTIASFFTPIGYAGAIAYLASATIGATYVGVNTGTYISNAVLARDIKLGVIKKELLITPYESLAIPLEKGGIGCQRIIN